MINIIKNNLISKNINIAIVYSRFNEFINKNLLTGVLDILKRIGKVKNKNIDIIKVPGSYEILITTLNLIKIKKYNAIIVLGTILKGETKHYKYLINNVNNNLIKLSLKYNIPISLGLLFVKNLSQAVNRSGMKFGNKGSEVALITLELINILKIIKNLKV